MYFYFSSNILLAFFTQAQKPWAKLLEKVTKAKMEYHTCCKNERSAINQERNATGDTSLSPDQVKKLQDRVIKCKEEVAKSREKYEVALREISDYNDKYSEEMKDVFEKCQDFEEKRLLFFKEVLYSIHSTLNISNDPKLPIIYEEYRHTIQNADASKDLKWWSNNHGSGMPTSWPIFEVSLAFDVHRLLHPLFSSIDTLLTFLLQYLCLHLSTRQPSLNSASTLSNSS